MIARRPNAAFTLLELVAVMAVVALVAGAGVTLMWQIAAMRQRSELVATATREAAVAMDRIAAALTNAYRPSEGDQVLFEGVDEVLDDRPADRLRLMTVSDQPVRGGAESDVREVAFELRMREAEPLPELSVRVDPTRNVPPDGGGIREPVARQVRALDLLYFDGVQWYAEWPVTREQLPRAVRIQIAVAEVDEHGMPMDDAHRVVSLRRLVAIPPLPQRRQQGQQNPSGDGS